MSILISTWNNLEYLRPSIESLRKHSRLDNEICVYIDGSTDGTHEWLQEQPDIQFIYNPEWIGSLTGRNQACKLATKEHVFLSEDGFIYSPEWDVNLMRWVEKLGSKTFVIPQLVQGVDSLYACPECGDDLDNFDEEEFLKFVKSRTKQEANFNDSWGLPVMTREMFSELGGHDTNFDPIGFGVIDLKLRAKQRTPDLRFARVYDVLLFHFISKSWSHLKGEPEWEARQRENEAYFQRKWGLSTSSLNIAYKLLLRDGWIPEKEAWLK